jgi:transposase
MVDRYPSNLPTDGQSFRRVEVPSGTPRRRRWSGEEKASIVAESLTPGAVARTVALRHGLHPHQLYAWRRLFASAGVAGDGTVSGFVPVAVSTARGATMGAMAGTVEIEVAGVVVRVAPGVEMGFLSAVLGAVKAA